MFQFDHLLNLTRSLLILLVCHSVSYAQDDPSAEEASFEFIDDRKLPSLGVQEIANRLYEDAGCRHLAFACANHGTLAPFKELDSFLKTTASKDTDFRYVLIELPADLKPKFVALSRGEITYDEFIGALDPPWRNMMTARSQLAFYKTLLKTIGDINAARPEHPILLLPVDGFTTQRVVIEVSRAQEAQQEGKQIPSFVDSANRERDTASNVLEIAKEFPGSRGAILFHQGHLLKRLQRELPELDDKTHQLVKREVTHSTWVGFAQEASPEFNDGLRLILFDEVDSVFNPHGVLLSEELGGIKYANLSGSIIRGTFASRMDPVEYFQSDSRIRRVHREKQLYPESIGQLFDAFVVVRE
ncbi:MAG: hypothetical protein AAGG48_11010 [Planctomycetota bacterium]